jgi:hypothetical protein
MTDMRGGFHARGVRAGSLSAMAVPGAMGARRRAGRGRIGGLALPRPMATNAAGIPIRRVSNEKDPR